MKATTSKKNSTKSTSNTLSETISFVIKGKLTPIKSSIISKKGKKEKPEIKPKTCKEKASKKSVDVKEVNKKCNIKKNVVAKSEPKTNLSLKKTKTKLKTPIKKTVTTKSGKKSNTNKNTKELTTSGRAESTVTSRSKLKQNEIEKKKTIKKLIQNATIVLKQSVSKNKTLAKNKVAKNILQKNKITLQDSKKVTVNKDIVSLPPKTKKINKEQNIKNDTCKSTTNKDNAIKHPLSVTKQSNANKKIKELNKEDITDTKKKKPTNANKLKKIKRPIKPKAKELSKAKKLKLYGLWNGPKKQRVASLNAIAKVHCLYENEVKGSLIDMELPLIKKEESKTTDKLNKEQKEKKEQRSSPIPQRTLRCQPGLRAVGKHWDMHDSSSSSSDDNEEICISSRFKKEENKKPEVPAKKRKRRQTEIIMDLKDMVVKKRMASLNATAILAASYEKRSPRSPKSDSSSSSESSDDDSDSCDDIRENKSFKKEKDDEEKAVDVRTKPNNKVSVILNQDTDVTITGVYVNSTTRSTHHEGYCSIAGMQYRISATSHTQTAATAVATETLLQTNSAGQQENSNSESLNGSSKSYTPLDALSNMRPPTADNLPPHHQGMGPHVMALNQHPPLSPGGMRHSCSSAFSSPHSTCHPPPTGHHPGESGYVHGYYQPAGPLITVPHGHAQPPLTKSAPLSESSPTSPSPLTPHPTHPAGSGDSSDNEILKSSIVKEIPQASGPSYRYPPYPQGGPPPHAGFSYSYQPHYYHPTPPPPPSYSHDMCYSTSYVHHKIPPGYSYRRYLQGSQYYTSNPPPDIYQVPPGQCQPSQQLVVTTPSTGSANYQPTPVPPPTIIETYHAPTLVETYSPYYPTHSPAPPTGCYTHGPPSRAMPYINGAFQTCPCPIQSCPKNGLTGPLTGDSKRSNTLPKNSMPLPPVALALPKEPTSDGPPSPARGSAGMPPPPSPAGATYQPPPPKQENPSPENDLPFEKKKKARVGKAMVRSNMQNTMLLMPLPQNVVKREIESPKEKEVTEEPVKEVIDSKDDQNLTNFIKKTDTQNHAEPLTSEINEMVQTNEIKTEEPSPEPLKQISNLILEPVVSSVAENVKVKNMKRKMSLIPEKKDDCPSPPKQIKIGVKANGSYKDLIKKKSLSVRINNGRRKILESMLSSKLYRKRSRKQKTKSLAKKRHSLNTINNNNTIVLYKNIKQCKTLNTSKIKTNKNEVNAQIENSKLNETNKKCKLTASNVLDNLINKNSVDKVIDCVVSDSVRTNSSKKNEKPVVLKEDYKKTVGKNTKGNRTSRKKSETGELQPLSIQKNLRKSFQTPRWSNGWNWEGESFEAKVFLNSDETTVIRKCYPAMRHDSGDIIEVRDCVLLKAGVRKNELPFVAKIASLWENPDDGEMMMSLLWYYRPEHTDQGRLPTDRPDEVFASRHKDSNSVACIDDKCYVLTYNEYCRYRKTLRRLEEGIEEDTTPCIPCQESYPRLRKQPPANVKLSPDMVFFCCRVYDFRQKRIIKNPS